MCVCKPFVHMCALIRPYLSSFVFQQNLENLLMCPPPVPPKPKAEGGLHFRSFVVYRSFNIAWSYSRFPVPVCLSGGGAGGWGGGEEEEEGGVCTHLRIAMGTGHEGQRGADGHHEVLHAGSHPDSRRTASVQELQQVHTDVISTWKKNSLKHKDIQSTMVSNTNNNSTIVKLII